MAQHASLALHDALARHASQVGMLGRHRIAMGHPGLGSNASTQAIASARVAPSSSTISRTRRLWQAVSFGLLVTPGSC
jgi:hypothetical protein